MHTWDLWYPKAAATGLPFARGRIDAAEKLLVHAAPDFLTVEVRDGAGRRVAFAQDLERTLQSPMCLLTIAGQAVAREDLWPDESHLELVVLLPGGEAGILKAWWHAEDLKEWRWQIELYNSIR